MMMWWRIHYCALCNVFCMLGEKDENEKRFLLLSGHKKKTDARVVVVIEFRWSWNVGVGRVYS